MDTCPDCKRPLPVDDAHRCPEDRGGYCWRTWSRSPEEETAHVVECLRAQIANAVRERDIYKADLDAIHGEDTSHWVRVGGERDRGTVSHEGGTAAQWYAVLEATADTLANRGGGPCGFKPDEPGSLAVFVNLLADERDEARDWVRQLTATERTLTCAFCGEAYPPGTPETNHERLTAHVKVCVKHPMREVEIACSAMREWCAAWLLRAYAAIHREGWEEGASTAEVADMFCDVLFNLGCDAGSQRAHDVAEAERLLAWNVPHAPPDDVGKFVAEVLHAADEWYDNRHGRHDGRTQNADDRLYDAVKARRGEK